MIVDLIDSMIRMPSIKRLKNLALDVIWVALFVLLLSLIGGGIAYLLSQMGIVQNWLIGFANIILFVVYIVGFKRAWRPDDEHASQHVFLVVLALWTLQTLLWEGAARFFFDTALILEAYILVYFYKRKNA